MAESRKRKIDSNCDEITANSKHKFDAHGIIDRVRNQAGIRGKLVLMYGITDEAFTILDSAVNHARSSLLIKNLGIRAGGLCLYQLRIDDEVVAEGEHPNESIARQLLSRRAFDNLQRHCFSILRKSRYADKNKVTSDSSKDATAAPEASAVSQEGPVTSETNKSSAAPSNSGTVPAFSDKAAKMMAKMGWSGGGLGAQEQGRVDVIETCQRVSRQGLGNVNISKHLKQMLSELASSKSLTALAFLKFTKEERAQIHSFALQRNLTTKSYGKGEDRFVVVQCKMSRWEMVERLYNEGGETEQYKLIYPIDITV